MVVIATPLPFPVDPFRSSVDTLLLSTDSRSLADQLNLLGGLWLPTYGGEGSIRPVSLEGGRSRGTLLAIQGIPLPSLFGEGADLSLLPPAWFQEAALLRGGASGWFGPGAFQGVLNLQWNTTPETRAGWSPHSLWLQVSPGPLTLYSLLWPDMDPPGTWIALRGKTSTGWTGMGVYRDISPPSPTAFPGRKRQKEQWGWVAYRSHVQKGHVLWFVESMMRTYTDTTLHLFSRHRSLLMRLTFTHPLPRGWAQVAVWQQPLQSTEMGQHTLGGLRIAWIQTPTTPVPLLMGVHAEAYQQDRHIQIFPSFRISARLDTHGWMLFPEAFLAWNPPAPGDLFWSGDAFAQGNPDLRPEYLQGVALTLQHARWPVRLRGYWKWARDLIQWTPGVHGLWMPSNLGRARLCGVMFQLSMRGLRFSWSWFQNRDARGHPLLYRPERLGSLFWIPFHSPRIHPWLHLTYTGSRVRSSRAWDRLPPRLDVGIGLTWTTSHGQIALSLDHMLDALWIPGLVDNRVGDLEGYPPPRRTLRVEWRITP